MDDNDLHETAMSAAQRYTRYQHLERAIVIIAGLVIVLALTVGAVALVRQGDIRETQAEIRRSIAAQECIATLTADFQAAVGAALAAPPAPNTARNVATEAIAASAEALRNYRTLCR